MLSNHDELYMYVCIGICMSAYTGIVRIIHYIVCDLMVYKHGSLDFRFILRLANVWS